MVDIFFEISTEVGCCLKGVSHILTFENLKIQDVSMSTSTIFIKRPLNYCRSLAVVKEKYKEYSPVLSAIMWTVSGLYAAAQSNFNSNITGITLSFPVSQILIMLIVSAMLCKGLATVSVISKKKHFLLKSLQNNIMLVLPWLSVTTYALYFNHYLGLLQTLTTVLRIKKLSWLPWFNLFLNILLLG